MKPHLLLLFVLGLAPSFAQATDPPNLLSLQLRLADSLGAPLAGPVSLDLRLYDAASGGNLLWAESQSATALDGVVAVQLGATTVLPPDVFTGGERFLGLSVEGDPEMVPRTKIASAPFARRAASVAALDAATVVPDGFVDGAAIADGAIGGAELSPGAVTSTVLAPGAVTATSLASGAVDASKLAPGAVDSLGIADGTVTGLDVADGTLTDADIGAVAAIQGTKILPDFGSLDLLTGGRIGIGVGASPESSVHVGAGAGAIRVDNGGGFSARNPNNLNASVSLNFKGDVPRLRLGGSGAGANSGFAIQRVGDQEILRIRDNGDLGLGTSSPDARLHVVDGSDVTPTSGGAFQIGSSSSSNLAFDTNEIMPRSGSGAGTLNLNIEGGDVRIGAGSGDGTVQLPSSSVSPDELLAEPGIAVQVNDTLVTVDQVHPSVNVLTARTITCPASGYVVALAHFDQPFGAGLGAPSYFFSISKETFSQHNSSNAVAYQAGLRRPVVVHGSFEVSAGSHNFYLLGNKTIAIHPDLDFGDPRLTLMFFPSAYGTVDVD